MKLYKYLKFNSAVVILFFCLVNFSEAASISFFTPSKAYNVGSDIVLSILVSNGSMPASGVSGLISFPANLVSISSISTDDSIVSHWIQEPSFSNSTGHINFETVLLSGFTGNLGKLITITFKAKAVGTASIKFIAGSLVTADDNVSDVLLNSEGTSITITKMGVNKPVPSDIKEEIKEAKVTNEDFVIKPDSSGWYSLDSASLTRIPSYPKVPIALIVSIILLIFVIWYLYYNLFKRDKKLKKEIHEAEDAVHKAFGILKESELEQIKILEKANSKRKPSVKKERIKRQFKKDLEDAEKYVEKEIDDIDELVNKAK